jgi:hypothetical protein
LLGYARTILRLNEDARLHLSGRRCGGRLRVGAGEDLAGWLPKILRAFSRQYPDARIEVEIGMPAFRGLPAPDFAAAGARRARVQAAMAARRAVAPGTGAYVNACRLFPIGPAESLLGSELCASARNKAALRTDCLSVTMA